MQRISYLFIVLISFLDMVSTSLDIFLTFVNIKLWSKQIKPFSFHPTLSFFLRKKFKLNRLFFFIKINRYEGFKSWLEVFKKWVLPPPLCINTPPPSLSHTSLQCNICPNPCMSTRLLLIILALVWLGIRTG